MTTRTGHRVFVCLLALLLTAPAAAGVVITEIMYHPTTELESEEFLELHNPGSEALDLSGWCVDGIGFCFPAGASIAPGQFLALARDAAGFLAKYGRAADHVYTGQLGNSGERIALLDAASTVVDEVTYSDKAPWPTKADGVGPSLEVIDPSQDNSTARNWRASIAAAGATPGAANSVSTSGLPPWISDVAFNASPAAGEPVAVAARVLDATSVSFTFVIDFGAETTVPMLDDGLSGDGAAGDGVCGAAIPGQPLNTLVRFRISATGPTGTMSHPRADDTVNYDGTMVSDASLASALPIFHWLMDPAAYQRALAHRYTDETEPAVFFYNGVLYDNIQVRVRGQSSRGWPKPHWKFKFPQGNEFFDSALIANPVDNFDLESSYGDKSYLRELLSYRTLKEAGHPSNQSFPVRLQQNGQFYGLYGFLEDPDRDWVERNGLDPDGARYKAYDDLSDRGSEANTRGRYEKDSRSYEDWSDIYALTVGINQSSQPARRAFLLDNVNLPLMLNYLAVKSIVHDNDHVAKNYILYRDTLGTGRWFMAAWDMDLTFGRNYNSGGVLNDAIWADVDVISGRTNVSPSHPLFGNATHQKYDYLWNKLIHAIYLEPDFLEMYHRRLRTLMDSQLAPGRYEAIVDGLVPKIAPEAAMDKAKWGQYGQAQTLDEAVGNLKSLYFGVRRTHLFTTHRVAGEIPEAQSAVPRIAISEIMYNPAGGSDHEFLELYNPSASESVDLSGWQIDGIGLTLPAGSVILPHAYVLVVKNDVAFRAQYGGGKFVAAQYSGSLANEGERIVLRDASGRDVASVAYAPSAPWPSPAAGGGSSLELIDPAQENGWVANWAASPDAGGTPGAPNGAAGTMPPFPGLYLNEVLPVNASLNRDEAGDRDPWIEIHNASAAVADLGGMTLTDDLAAPGKFVVPAGTSLCAGCWLLVWADNEPAEGPRHAPFRLSGSGGRVALFTASGILADELAYPALPSNVSYGRYPDGSSDRRTFSHVTPEAANDAQALPMLLNEYNAVTPANFLKGGARDTYWGIVAGNGGDWFELVVTRDHLDARGYSLVISNDTGGAGQTITTLTLTNAGIWSDLRSGTIITVAEDLADDVSYAPASDDWWINVRASSAATGANITPANFDVTQTNWQLTIKDAAGAVVFGPSGEGINPVSGVGNDEIFKLEENPTPFVTPYSSYADGTSSTFGSPNIFSGGTASQSFDALRCAGLDCSVLDGPCQVGACNGMGACEARATRQGLACDDGDPCTLGDACSGTACRGTSLDCSALDDGCNVGVCVPSTVSCAAQPFREGLACDDGDGCTVADTCLNGACLGPPRSCDDGDVCSTDACSGGACAHGATGNCGIGGAVRYYRDAATGSEPSGKPVPGVRADLGQDGTADATTGQDGGYAIGSLYGPVILSTMPRWEDPEDAGLRDAVTSFDATMIARQAVGLSTLSANQRIAADVSGNQEVTSYDAAQVAQFAVRLRNHFEVAESTGSDWRFFRCDHYTDASSQDCAAPLYIHPLLGGAVTDDFHAVLYGDVTGNWAPAAALRAPSSPEREAVEKDRLEAGRLRAAGVKMPPGGPRSRGALLVLSGWRGPLAAGERRELTLGVLEGDGIEALDLQIGYDARSLSIVEVHATGLGGQLQLVQRDDGGSIRCAMYGTRPLQGSGALLSITVEARRPLGPAYPLGVGAKANEGRIPLRVEARAPVSMPRRAK